MDYGIPILPAAGGGIVLTTFGFYGGNHIALMLGVALLVIVLFSHINLRKNEK